MDGKILLGWVLSTFIIIGAMFLSIENVITTGEQITITVAAIILQVIIQKD